MSGKKGKINYREDMKFSYGKLTVERQLHMYEKHPDKSERSATLWHAWHQNKSWLIRLLELTLASFPSYSRHDASHAETVLHNIERILGEHRIVELGVTDCFAILHTVYIHDIGMAIMAADREEIVKSDGFVDMVDLLAEGADEDLKEASLQLKKNVYYELSKEETGYEELENYDEKKYLYQEKLKTHYAIVQLLMEYQRKLHGEKVASSVKDWLLDGDKIRTELSMSGIPMRIFFRIADCASLHTDWDFGHIMELPVEENGYENDMLHPRFVAVLLQLGDALDIDNDRFHPFTEAFLGQLPVQSQAHYEKHLAIRTLKITPEEILIEADCKTRDAIRLIKYECDGIEKLLRSASYYWSSIVPKGLGGALPTFIPPKLFLNGAEIPLDLIMTRFSISQQKAFSLLLGESARSGDFLFVRELLQNAIDSTKIQCYEDYKRSSEFRFKNCQDNNRQLSIMNIAQIIKPLEYPIEISIKCCKLKKSDKWEEVDIKDISEKENGKERYGILFSIKDYGIGIDANALREISSVGTNNKKIKNLVKEMPNWLRPTGEFGIGLQSVFLVNDKFYCETFSRSGEHFRIEFLTETNGERGYINIEPKNADGQTMQCCTIFEVFISHDKRKEPKEFSEIRTGYDPFTDEYMDEKIQRNITALTVQILLDIDKQVEDLLFPVYAYVGFDLGQDLKMQMKNKLSKIVFDDLITQGNYNEKSLMRNVCWMYRYKGKPSLDGNIVSFAIENGVCMVDLWSMRVNLWLEDVSVNACIGVDYLVEEGLQMTKSQCKLYYKGVLIETRYVEESGNLLEYIDIQGGREGRKLIQLNRNGLTKEGEEYVDTVIVPKIYSGLLKALELLAGQEFVGDEKDERLQMAEKIKKNMQEALQKERIEWKRQLVGVSLYYNFYMRKYENSNITYLSKKAQNEKKQWEDSIRHVERAMQNYGMPEMSEISGTVQAIKLHARLDSKFHVLGVVNISIADFYDRSNKFAVVSKRRDKGDKWINTLVWLKSAKEGIDPEDGVKISKSKLIEILEDSVAESIQWEEKEKKLELWADFFLKNIVSIIGFESVQQSDLVLELLQSVSIRACFADEEGNLKVHILTGQSSGGVFYNINAKYRLLKKMSERNSQTHAKRFAGNVWMGYESLRVDKIQEDVCNIKEKYIGQNLDFMLMPCNGDAVVQLVQLAEGAKKDEENEKYVLIKDQLLEAADLLEACLKFDYREVMNEELFKTQHSEYCKNEQILLRRDAFGSRLRNGYLSLLNEKFKNTQRTYEQEPKMLEIEFNSAEEIKLMQEKDLLTPVKIQELRKDITSSIVINAQHIMKGEWNPKNMEYVELHKHLDILIGQCYKWKYMWGYLENLQIDQNMTKIMQHSWTNASERTNLIEWTSRQVNSSNSNMDAIEEFYDNIWNVYKNVIKYHRKKLLFQKYQFNFLELLNI